MQHLGGSDHPLSHEVQTAAANMRTTVGLAYRVAATRVEGAVMEAVHEAVAKHVRIVAGDVCLVRENKDGAKCMVAHGH